MSTQETERKIEVGDFVKFVKEYEDNWNNPKVKVGATGKVVNEHQSGIYENGRLDVTLDNGGPTIKQIPYPFLKAID